jgi:Ca2+-binding RTX toxin-like protein
VTTGTTALNINAAVVLNALSITGNNGNNILTGTNFGDTLIGNGGNDTLNGGLGADTMSGGAGNDTYAVDNVGEVIVETLNQGTDLVQVAIATANSSYTLLDHLENATLTNAVNFNLTGNGLNNTLTGNALNNTLDGGAGVDTLIGGTGDDTYIVDLNPNGTLQDTITEIALATNNDKVQLRGTSTNTTVATLTLAANLEHLDASATGSSLLNLTGNTANNQLTGNTANNILNGLAGVDTMAGGAGNDTYVVDNLNDIVTELLNEGTDLVQVAIATAGGTYVMTTNVENGTLTNTVAYNLTGNELNNTLTGNAAANTLTGLDGNDTLNGLAGADRMLGGLGDDTYTVDNVGDVVIELANQGTDTILSSVTYALNTANAIGVENLTLTGTTAINGTGNDLNNTITGNTGINILNGGAGNDTLNGGLGNDNLTGGLGSDTFVFNTALNATANRDIITDFLSGTDKIELENSIMTGLGSSTGQLTIDQFRSGAGVTTAGDASDRIIYNNTTGGLFYDADGLGGTAAIQIALIGVNTVLTSQDIFIV